MEERALLCAGCGTDPARMGAIAGAIVTAGVPAVTWHYAAGGSIGELAERLAVAAGDADRFHLIGHSLGGLVVARAALGLLGDRVASVTTVNTPWRGTWLGWTGGGPLAEELRYGSPGLAALRADLRDHLRAEDGPSWLAVGVSGDLGTPPSTSLRVPRGARMRRSLVAANGHSLSLAAPRVVAVVADHVRASSRVAA